MTTDPERVYYQSSKPLAADPLLSAIKIGVGEYECLSNTHRCKVYLPGDDEPYFSVEHAFQASKTSDSFLRSKIRLAGNAIDAKKIAREINLSDKWRAESEQIMNALLRDKFKRHRKYRDILLSTGNQFLVFINDYNDRVWGICQGKGENKLGILLSQVRQDIKSDADTISWARVCFDLEEEGCVRLQLKVSKGGVCIGNPIIEGKSIVQVGKLNSNNLNLEHLSISRRHALILVTRNCGLKLVCLEAANGTYVNGARIAPFVPVHLGNSEENSVTFSFGASKRMFTIQKVERNLREVEKMKLYTNVSNPPADTNRTDSVYVGNIPEHFTEDRLRGIFSQCGEILKMSMPKARDGQSGHRGIAFITFSTVTGISRALAMDRDDIEGKEIRVRRLNPMQEKEKVADKHRKSRADMSTGHYGPNRDLSKRRMTVEREAAGRLVNSELQPKKIEKSVKRKLRHARHSSASPSSSNSVPLHHGKKRRIFEESSTSREDNRKEYDIIEGEPSSIEVKNVSYDLSKSPETYGRAIHNKKRRKSKSRSPPNGYVRKRRSKSRDSNRGKGDRKHDREWSLSNSDDRKRTRR